MRAKHLLPLCTLLASVASAQVYIGDVVFGPNPIGPGMATGLTSLSGGGKGACGFSFQSIDSGGLATRIGAINIAELYSLFVVAEGTAFDAAYVSGHSAVVNNSGTLPPFTLPYEGQAVLFAYWDDRAAFGGTGAWGEVDGSDLFGWMRIAFSTGTDPQTQQTIVQWTLLDSATAKGGGIVAGTYTQIPEPAAASLLLGLAAFVTTNRRRSPRADRGL